MRERPRVRPSRWPRPELDQPLASGSEVDLQLPALLPEDYIPDVHLRLQLYKRMASAVDVDRLDDLEAELVDRFGPLPPPSKTLLVVHRLRQRAAALGIRRFELGAAAGVVEFGREHRVEPDRVVRLVKQPGGRYRLDGPNRLRLKITTSAGSARIAAAEKCSMRLTVDRRDCPL